jgi:hypothetical protein
MKSTIYLTALVLFSALLLSPKMPKEYPPKKVLDQRESIVFKETKIDHLINKIEFQLAKDSIVIKNIKNESSQTN